MVRFLDRSILGQEEKMAVYFTNTHGGYRAQIQ